MNRSITKAQRAELEEACTFGVEDAHDLLRKYTGIEARPYTAYLYYDENGDFVGSSDNNGLNDLLEKANVEVRDG
jgi:hypothetical protein